MLADRGIGFHPNTTVTEVQPDDRQLALTDGSVAGYDLLLGIPPHRPPTLIRSSGLAAESGFLPVDAHTLATAAGGVFGIGDATAIPLAGGKFLPKAGVFAEAEAKVVARNIADELAGRPAEARFDGVGACFVELGDGRAAFATGNFYAPDGPAIHLRHPGRAWHLAKVGFEKYWLRRWT
jgi:sulfide:quinone oxidoreductase